MTFSRSILQSSHGAMLHLVKNMPCIADGFAINFFKPIKINIINMIKVNEHKYSLSNAD